MTKYKHPAGNMQTFATTPQSHRRPTNLRVSSPLSFTWGRRRSGTADMRVPASDGRRLLVTHIWMLREMHVVVPMTAQHTSGRIVVQRSSVLSKIFNVENATSTFKPNPPRISSVKWVAGQQMACKARRRMSVDKGG